jgi:hypothetical protein
MLTKEGKEEFKTGEQKSVQKVKVTLVKLGEGEWEIG